MISALALIVITLVRGDQPYWLLQGMELTLVVAGGVAIAFALGKFWEGPGLTLICCAGVFVVAGFLGWLSVRQGVTLKGGATWSLSMVRNARFGAGLVLALLAMYEVLARHPLSRGFMVRTIASGVVMAGLAVALYKGNAALTGGTAMAAWIGWTLLCLGAVAVLTLLCISVHCAIRAFEVSRDPLREVQA